MGSYTKYLYLLLFYWATIGLLDRIIEIIIFTNVISSVDHIKRTQYTLYDICSTR